MYIYTAQTTYTYGDVNLTCLPNNDLSKGIVAVYINSINQLVPICIDDCSVSSINHGVASAVCHQLGYASVVDYGCPSQVRYVFIESY